MDTKPYTETVTLASDTSQMDAILQRLDAEMEFTTEDSYTGVLKLDHTSVKVEADGYKTSTRPVSTSRVYPGLSDADVSLIPKTDCIAASDRPFPVFLKCRIPTAPSRYSSPSQRTTSRCPWGCAYLWRNPHTPVQSAGRSPPPTQSCR